MASIACNTRSTLAQPYIRNRLSPPGRVARQDLAPEDIPAGPVPVGAHARSGGALGRAVAADPQIADGLSIGPLHQDGARQGHRQSREDQEVWKRASVCTRWSATNNGAADFLPLSFAKRETKSTSLSQLPKGHAELRTPCLSSSWPMRPRRRHARAPCRPLS